MNINLIFAIITLGVIGALLYPVFRAGDILFKSRFVFSAMIMVFFLGGGFLLYNQFGTPEILPLLAERSEKLNELKGKITASAEEVKRNPDNLKAWVELGYDFMETGQFSASSNAFKKAVYLSQGEPEFIMAYVRALIMEADGEVTEAAKKSLDILLMLQPKNEEARYYMAVWKLQSGDTENAMAEMKALYKSLPADSPVKGIIDRQIGRK
jgi:cytochrome c-type biogenesis protein CcmH